MSVSEARAEVSAEQETGLVRLNELFWAWLRPEIAYRKGVLRSVARPALITMGLAELLLYGVLRGLGTLGFYVVVYGAAATVKLLLRVTK